MIFASKKRVSLKFQDIKTERYKNFTNLTQEVL
jgi:hypothetical protein